MGTSGIADSNGEETTNDRARGHHRLFLPNAGNQHQPVLARPARRRDLVSEVDPGRWAQDTFLHPRRNHPGTSYTFAAGSFGDIATFDAPSSAFRRAKPP
jgi:hypothetical protein